MRATQKVTCVDRKLSFVARLLLSFSLVSGLRIELTDHVLIYFLLLRVMVCLCCARHPKIALDTKFVFILIVARLIEHVVTLYFVYRYEMLESICKLSVLYLPLSISGQEAQGRRSQAIGRPFPPATV